MSGKADTQTLYNQTANHWIRQAPSSLSDYTARPQVLALCEPVAGKRVLDLGCGEGYCSRKLRRMGAEVIGIDLSERMIEYARQEEAREPLGIHYRVGDAAAVDLGEAKFDLIVAVFLFNYLNVEQMHQTLANAYRMLRPTGSFVFAIPHPAFPFIGEPRPPFYFDIGRAGYFSARNSLFPGRIWKRDGTALDVQLVHKTLEDYFEGLRVAGFRTMPMLVELKVTPDMLGIDPDFFSPLIDVPLHIAMKVERNDTESRR